VLWTKPRAEKRVAQALEAQDIPNWLPTITVRRQWSDRWQDVEFPLFPGYLFVQNTSAHWSELLNVPGVLTVVKHGNNAARVRESQISELKAAIPLISTGDQQPEVVNDFELADRVSVIDGPLAGLVGVVREIRGRGRRLLIGFEQIGRAVAILIGSAQLRKCSP
jgi:transcription antitermination factor NusG